jgi:hypothetical protein
MLYVGLLKSVGTREEATMHTTTPHPSDIRMTDHLVRRLVADYADRYPASVVEELVRAVHDRMAGARVPNFLPILVERQARELLDGRGPR